MNGMNYCRGADGCLVSVNFCHILFVKGQLALEVEHNWVRSSWCLIFRKPALTHFLILFQISYLWNLLSRYCSIWALMVWCRNKLSSKLVFRVIAMSIVREPSMIKLRKWVTAEYLKPSHSYHQTRNSYSKLD